MASQQGADVLVVDDDDGVREVLQRILQRVGYQVRTATHAHDALRQLREAPPAVVVTDIHMPGPSGVWLAQQIREEFRQTAIILVTTDRAVPATESMRRGVVAYLIKPFDPARVTAAVAAAYAWWANESGGQIPALTPVVPAAAAPAPPPLGAPQGWAPAPQGAPPQAWGQQAPQGMPPQAWGQQPPQGAPQAWGYGAAPPGAQPSHQPPSRSVPLKTVLIIAAIAAAIVAGLLYWTSRNDGRLLSRVAASSGMVLVFDGAGKSLVQGSGFFIAPDIFVTNRHVVAGGTTAKIVVGSNQYAVSGTTGVDAENDLVLLRTAVPAAAHLQLSSTPPKMGDAIAVYGAPRGLDGTLSTGIVSTNRTDPTAPVQITAPISPGSSGSPVLDQAGQVIAVVRGSNTMAQGVHFAVPAGLVQALIDHAGNVRSLASVSRGEGDDRERHELIGPVRRATITGPNPDDLFFDREGRLITQSSGDKATEVNYVYDGLGRLASEIHVQQQTPVKTWTFRALGPQLVTATEEQSGEVKRLEYDAKGRLQSEELRIPGQTLFAYVWTYPTDAWPAKSASAVTGSAVAEGDKLDDLGNFVRRTWADGSVVTYTYRFDKRGNWVSREGIRADASGQPLETTTETRSIWYWDEVSN